MASKSSEPSAPPLPPGDLSDSGLHLPRPENQPLIHDYGSSFPYGQNPPPYQQYMAPPPAYGIPMWQHQHQEIRREWTTGLCHCMADIPICLLGCLCPCFLFGKIAEKMDDSITSCLTPAIVWYILQQFTSLGCIYSCGYRSRLRARYHLPERPLPDCLVHWLCWQCAFCQEYRELRIRRIEEEARVARSVMAPPHHQSMNC